MINIAIVQFGNDNEELKELIRTITREKLAHWYYFDETADRDFEIKALLPHYDSIYECIDIENFEEVK